MNKFQDLEDELNATFWRKIRSGYPLTTEDSHTIQQHFHTRALRTRPELTKRYHWTEVVQLLRTHNDPNRPLSPKQQRACKYLKSVGDLPSWRPRLVAKMFLDIDDLLFASMLRDNIALRWGIEPETTPVGYTVPPGQVVQGNYTKRTAVVLNASLLMQETMTVHHAIEVLIHEFCHAILFVMCWSPYEDRHDVGTMDRNGYGVKIKDMPTHFGR